VNKVDVFRLYVDDILLQLVKSLMFLRCAVSTHHASESSLSLLLCQLDIVASIISHLLLLLNCVSVPSTALDASVMSDKGRIEVTGASVATLWAGLLQRYTNRNS